MIVGWYQGNARTEDTVLPERAIKVAETIKKNNGDKSIIFLVKSVILSFRDGYRLLTRSMFV